MFLPRLRQLYVADDDEADDCVDEAIANICEMESIVGPIENFSDAFAPTYLEFSQLVEAIRNKTFTWAPMKENIATLLARRHNDLTM